MRETNNNGIVKARYSVCISYEAGSLIDAVENMLAAKNAHVFDSATGEVLATIDNGDVNISAKILRRLLCEAYNEGADS